jgi:hypothetical protein
VQICLGLIAITPIEVNPLARLICFILICIVLLAHLLTVLILLDSVRDILRHRQRQNCQTTDCSPDSDCSAVHPANFNL